ncbi:MAG: folate-binding protein [Propionibacteriaceae bacterium]|nr:folate-binding protein [Propionibacteriaceae bacterium]
MSRVLVADGVDAGLPWHYGDPLGEQRHLDGDGAVVDLSNRDVVCLTGPERAIYLDLVTTQKLTGLGPGQAAWAYRLDGQGHIEDDLHLVEADQALWAWTEPGLGSGLVDFLEGRKFRLQVTTRLCPELALVWASGRGGGLLDLAEQESWVTRRGPDSLGGAEVLVPRPRLAEAMAAGHPVGLWGWEARRIAAGRPRIGLDTDQRTLPNELGLPSPAVALDKGCYPGQETVARVHNVGHPPRRLVRLHLDGSADRLLASGTDLSLAPSDRPAPTADDGQNSAADTGDAHSAAPGAPVARLGSMAWHWESGPIGLALVPRRLPEAATLLADGVACAVESLVDPGQGLHFRSDLPSGGSRRRISLSG